MLLTFKSMDNLQYIECHQRICYLFFIFKLICCKFTNLKEKFFTHSIQNHYITLSRSSTLLRIFLMGRYTKRGNLGSLPADPKCWTFPFCWISSLQKIVSPCPLMKDHTLEKKISQVALREILSKVMPGACIFSNTIMTYMKRLVGTKSLTAKQCSADYLPQLDLIILLNIYGKTWECRRIPPKSQKFTHFLHQTPPSLILIWVGGNLSPPTKFVFP